MIQQLYDAPTVNSRKSIQQLFQDQPADQLQIATHSSRFIAFRQERDKLGHLKATQTPTTQQTIIKTMSSRRLNNREYNRKTQLPYFTSDKTVERVFKITQIRQNKPSKHNFRLKLVNPSHSSSDLPVLSNQRSAQLINKFKYRRIAPVQIVEEKQKLRSKTNNNICRKPSTGMIVARNNEEQSQKFESEQLKKKVDYNLPQLKTYNQMKKLKMKLCDNFEENHLKFKQLVRDSLVLAQKIKQGLQFD